MIIYSSDNMARFTLWFRAACLGFAVGHMIGYSRGLSFARAEQATTETEEMCHE